MYFSTNLAEETEKNPTGGQSSKSTELHHIYNTSTSTEPSDEMTVGQKDHETNSKSKKT